MTSYHGKRVGQRIITWAEGEGGNRPIMATHRLWDHSPAGFEWGYGGSGPAQLALSLCRDALEGQHRADGRAIRCHQLLKRDLVARFPREGWVVSRETVLALIAGYEAKEREVPT